MDAARWTRASRTASGSSYEEGELFKEDFEQLTERAESAAKKAGYASLSAQNPEPREPGLRVRQAAELRSKPPRLRRQAYWKPHGRPNSKTCAEAAAARADAKALEIANRVTTMPRTRPRLRRGPRQLREAGRPFRSAVQSGRCRGP